MNKLTPLLISLMSAFAFGQNAPLIIWQKCLGGSSDESALAIHQISDGGFIIAGDAASIDGNVSGKKGYIDFWIVKLDANKNLVWQKCLGGTNGDFSKSIQETNDHGFIVAGITLSNDSDVSGNHGANDYWIVKLDSVGNIQWQKCIGGSYDDYCQDIQLTSDDGFILAGWTNSNNGDVTGNHGEEDYWIVKLNSFGDIEWQKCFGGSLTDEAYSIRQTKDQGFIVAGFSGSVDGDVSDNHGYYDYWIVKLDSTGNLLWQKSIGGSNDDDYPFCIQVTNDNGFIVAGLSESNDFDVSGNHGHHDYWIVRLDSVGDILWQKSLGGTSEDYYAYAIQQTFDGRFIIAGSVLSNDGDVSGNHGMRDAWIVRLDWNGNLLWQKCLGGSEDDDALSIIQLMDGSFLIAGDSYSHDGDVTGNHGGYDLWLVELSSDETGIENSISNNLISIFPNPTTTNLHLHYTLTQPGELMMFDALGRKVKSSTLPSNQNTFELSVAELPVGVYLIAVESEGKWWREKVVKE